MRPVDIGVLGLDEIVVETDDIKDMARPTYILPSTKLWGRRITVILSSITILVCGVMIWVQGCIFCANIMGVISIAFPPPEKVAKQYFEAVLAGNIDAVSKLTIEEGNVCRVSTLEMAQQHIEQFGSSQVKDENIAVGYWAEAPTDFSPARKQIASITFKFRKSNESEWQSGKIQFSIWQSGWRYVVCGPPG